MDSTKLNISINILPYEKDIYIHHELKEDSEFLIDKVSIIHGEVPIDYENLDGKIDVISSKEDWYEHYVYWRNYLNNHYVTDSFMRQWFQRRESDYFALIVRCLDSYGDIILLDITDLDEEEPREEALLFIPESITESQYRTLEENSNYISSYKSILIQGGESVDDPEIFFDSSFELPINESIQGSTFPSFLKDTLKNYQKCQEIENKKQ